MRIAICIPTRDMVCAGFAFDLATLCGELAHKKIKSTILHCNGTLLPELRNNLAKSAVRQGYEYTFWLDSDMRFPSDAVERLLKHDKHIVGANYVTRSVPTYPTAHNFDPEKATNNAFTVPTTEKTTGLQTVDCIGFGCLLIKTEVFKALEDPWFHLGYSTVNDKFIGEDVYFCLKAAAKGFPVFVDHDLSKEVHHIGSFEYRHEHVIEEECGAYGN